MIITIPYIIRQGKFRIRDIDIWDVGGAVRRDLMQDDEFLEFSIAHRRKYSIKHVWYQENDEQFTIGISDFLAKEMGEVFRVILPHADEEFDEDDEMFSIWTANGKNSFRTPFSGTVMEVNGEIEISPDLINDSPYDLGWMIIFKPHHLNDEDLLDPDEYLETLEELE